MFLQGAQMPYRIIWKATCLVLILILNILKVITIVLIRGSLIIILIKDESGDRWINPALRDEESIHDHVASRKRPSAGEESAVERRTRLLHWLRTNLPTGNLILSFVRGKELDAGLGKVTKCWDCGRPEVEYGVGDGW